MFWDNLKHWNLKKKSGGILSGGILSGGILEQGDFVQGGFVLGGYFPGGYCPGGYCPDTRDKLLTAYTSCMKVGTGGKWDLSRIP